MNTPEGEATIFEEALRLPPAERAAYLDQATGGDAALRERIEALLGSYAEGDFLEGSAAPDLRATLQVAVPLTEKPGDRIGRYKLLQQIGEGGCGVVYMADQTEPVRRRVALKIIKLGMDTKQVVARFEAERQALAIMDHPNIARVLDAGTTATGRPYFVMELVRGTKITEFSDQKKLSPEERIKLFVPVCQAVQHAHQKGIIHRDLKPSNILVTIIDGQPVPKVIDFGIAKATSDQRLTDMTLFTAFEQFIGTPAYMSPEQAQMSGVDVDTRTDIYSLGVVLYELLTGKTPFETEQLVRAGLDEIRRTIREQEPAKPSTRLQSLSPDDLTTVAAARQTEVPKLISIIRGDLDWIIMKCLEKDRNRRYESASAFAEDLRRHLGAEPIFARPPSAVYSLRKSIRRHRLAFAAVTAVATALLLGLATSTWMFLREREARARAVEAEQRQFTLRKEAENSRNLAREKEEEAKLEASRQKQLAEFAFEMFNDVRQAFARTKDRALLQEVIDRSMDRAASTLKDQPASAALFYSQMGDHFRSGNAREAEAMWRKALRLFSVAPTPDRNRAGSVALSLGYMLLDQERIPEAEAAFREGCEWLRAEVADPQRNETTSIVYRRLASTQALLGKNTEAEETFRAGVEFEKRVLNTRGSERTTYWALAVQSLVQHQEEMGNTSAAEQTYRDAIQFRPDWISGRMELAAFLRRRGRLEEAYDELKTAYTMAAANLDGKEPDDPKAPSLRKFAEEYIELAWLGRGDAGNSNACTAAKMSEQLAATVLRAHEREDIFADRSAYFSNVLGRAMMVVIATSPQIDAEKREAMVTDAEDRILSSVLQMSDSSVAHSYDLYAGLHRNFEKAVETIYRFYTVRNELTPKPEWERLAQEWKSRLESIAGVRRLWERIEPLKEKIRLGAGDEAWAEAEDLSHHIVSMARKTEDRFPMILGLALHHRGEVLLHQKKWEQAEAVFLEALKLVKENPSQNVALTNSVIAQAREIFRRYDNVMEKPEGFRTALKLLSDPSAPGGFLREEKNPATKCFENLGDIEGAKQQWGLWTRNSDGVINTNAVPTSRDLWGLKGWLRSEPRCPSGGSYRPGALHEKPRCTVHGSL